MQFGSIFMKGVDVQESFTLNLSECLRRAGITAKDGGDWGSRSPVKFELGLSVYVEGMMND